MYHSNASVGQDGELHMAGSGLVSCHFSILSSLCTMCSSLPCLFIST